MTFNAGKLLRVTRGAGLTVNIPVKQNPGTCWPCSKSMLRANPCFLRVNHVPPPAGMSNLQQAEPHELYS